MGSRGEVGMLRASDGRRPARARRRRWPRPVVVTILAAATVIALTGLAGPASSAVPPPLAASAHLDAHLGAVGIDGVVGFTGVKTAPAPSGQRATPSALPAPLLAALLVMLLLAAATTAPSTRRRALRRLPSRRAPPQHAFSR